MLHHAIVTTFKTYILSNHIESLVLHCLIDYIECNRCDAIRVFVLQSQTLKCLYIL